MSTGQNLAYTAIQVVHNFGAVAAVGGSYAAWKLGDANTKRKLAWLALAGWGAQAASGATFGATSYYLHHQFPDIGEIAIVALGIKMACAASGFTLLTAWLFLGSNWTAGRINTVLASSFTLAVTALGAAAFLRWFS